ncbi:receptor-like tyrosine-protein kinase kin-15 isoform X2 [Eurytemora carolleeae]|uniref:receptor-like tyrosine-protein kinase kin-15 isoform X2 n=1 Tax=Eurytemora carolleeae TaxID=1294199 RepID=UPI000C79260E|nr:receptor-like tyrosine-protein kinase kin-15 isoform X2 [Eurytemora carolleeae]|eukprot:XP_023330882.1 receptor-like tyrosine-protein kinase kin-15 isoform X2 [Eurytemora affinis]
MSLRAEMIETIRRRPTWSIRNTSIVKELGRGFYSKVYLAQDPTYGLVALKTADGKRENLEECISNEIEILSNINQHKNIVRLLGQNMEEKLIILEYCFHGNLKDYITRNREYFINEVDPETQELLEDSVETSVDLAEKSGTLVKTRRLLYWSYQMSRGLRYLEELGVIHRDIALR